MKHLHSIIMTLAWLCITAFLLPPLPAGADVVILTGKQAVIKARPPFIHDKERFISALETKRPVE